MKKLRFLLILPIFIILFSTSCTVIDVKEILSPLFGSSSSVESESAPSGSDDVEKDSSSSENSSSSSESSSSSSESSSSSNESSSDSSEKPEDTNEYIYQSFTPAEKKTFTELFGEVIPFLPNDEYYVEEYGYQRETGVNYYTIGNTQAEFDEYRQAFSAYELTDTYQDEYGDTWYTYQKGDYYVDMAYYEENGESCVDVYVYVIEENGGALEHLHTDFTSDEKKAFIDLFGEVIPFLPNDEYGVDEYTYEDEEGLNFYTFGNTQAEFDEYRQAFSAYELTDTYQDEYGDTWYTYQKGDYYVDMAYYEENGESCVDVYVYVLTGSGDGGDNGETGNDELLTNDGKGLPQGTDGVYEVDFASASYVKNVTEQGSYQYGCPTVGAPGVLVIPVEFSDATAQSRGYEISTIQNAFGKDGQTDYYSLYDYYRISSYGRLTLDITVVGEWFRPKNASSYYESATMDYYGEQVAIGDQMVMDEALAYLSRTMDLSKFDSDSNGTIDAVVLVTTLDVGEDDFHWAYRYWNIYADENEECYEYDGVYANDYLWASYQFLHESYDENGEVNYADKTAVNTYTYIHEFGHILGADDYYDTAGIDSPMGGCDIMDSMAGDHNAYTKFHLGWLTSSRLVTTTSSVTLRLEDFSKNGDTIIVANDWDPTLGAYQEYYIVVYYKSQGLNAGEGGYFLRDGIVVYHVNASLYQYEYDGETYYDVYNNNTHVSDEYGTEENLIEYVLSDEETYTYVVGNYLPAVKDDGGETLAYTFTVDALEDGFATLTFTKTA